MKKELEIRTQLRGAKKDLQVDPSQRTQGYIDALEWVLEVD